MISVKPTNILNISKGYNSVEMNKKTRNTLTVKTYPDSKQTSR